MVRFEPIFDSYLAVILAALVLVALLVLGPARGRLTRGRRTVLLALRAGVVVLVILAMLRPAMVYTETKKRPATLALLIDHTRSMGVRDAVGGKSRWEALRRALSDAAPALGRLAKDFELKVYTFDAQTHSLSVEGGKIVLEDMPDGKQTAIGPGLKDVRDGAAASRKRLLGVILFSDGAQRALAPRDGAPQTVAMLLRQDGCPLHTVAFGQPRGLGQAQDVAMKELLVSDTVFVKNELSVGGQLRADGYVNREIPVRLWFETAPGKMEKVAEEKVKITADGQLLPVRLNYAPQVAGEFKLTLEAEPQPGELVTTNNQLSTFVQVLKGGLSVLYLEGSPPRVETVFLSRALRASPNIKVDYVRVDPRHLETRPGDLAERFKPGKYDAYLIGDLDSSVFQPNELSDLAETVNKGAGLMMLGGFHSFGPGGYGGTRLANVLPVVMPPNERQRLDDTPSPDLHWPGPLQMRPTPQGLMHFTLMLAGTRKENEDLWRKLPPLEGANRFRDLSPAGQVLADATTPDGKNVPLLVAHQYGNGRVLAFAGDSTWHWWMRGYPAAHKRFWRQVILWLARKDQATEGAVWVKLDKRRFAPGERAEFTVGASTASGEPIKDADFDVQVVLPDGTRRAVRPARQGEQVMGALRETQAAGDYAIEVAARHQGQALGSTRARFLVYEQDLELDNAAADIDLMQSLAAMTGGEALAPEELPGLIDRIMKQTEKFSYDEVVQPYRPFSSEHKKYEYERDMWLFFALMVALLGTEWYLRKRWGLV